MSDVSPFLYRDSAWLVVDKPTGISTHAANAGDLGVAEWLELHLALEVHVCSRLDKGTSGVLLMALTPAASAEAQKIHEQQVSNKTYFFISDKKPRGEKIWISKKPLDGKECETSFELVKQGRGHNLYRANITRGRKHQIRRHAAASGIPILGDDEYRGSFFPRLCLHCAEVAWPDISEPIKSPMPQSFEWLLAGKSQLFTETAAAYERRGNLLRCVTDAFRVVHRGEVQELPFAVDVFGEWMCVTGFDEDLPSAELFQSLEKVFQWLEKACGCRGGVIRTNRLDPHRRKLFGDIFQWGEPPPETYFVQEHGLSYEVALNDAQHVGLFLDQRDSRRRIARLAEGKRVANLFAFTCSFSSAAVQGDAEVAFSVDLAAGCLERGKTNFAESGLTDGGRGKFIKEDARKWLARQLRREDAAPWDIVICDPPVFASSGKGRSFSVEKAWPELAREVAEILADDGVALFCNNHRTGSDSYYFQTLEEHFPKVVKLRPPLDFPELPGLPTHVRIYLCSKQDIIPHSHRYWYK